ncbi:MAG: DNA primase small subunit [Candidatus Methanoperedens nitroreducens]|uniref:DNA primase small subunit n=1 Tax=Candidatus Methanoperedens nitratireducens TaxID=1392998 RepID=A0A0P8AH65_9EURY|nr:MAG: DNA primase small subunit [Candidatus Methanoperedens sp. BLZ1]
MSIDPYKIKFSNWRPSTAKEIKAFYKETFPGTWNTLPDYLKKSSPIEYAFAFLRPIRTISLLEKDFVRRGNRRYSLEDLRNLLLDFKKYDSSEDIIIENSQIAGFYFSLKTNNGWLLAFDIDSKDVAMAGLCEHHPGIKPDADDKEIAAWRHMISGIPPVHPKESGSYLYCFNCIQIAVNKAFETRKILIQWGFAPENIHVYYSGQGVHIHVLEDEAWQYQKETRSFIIKMLNNAGIPLDSKVTADERRVLRFTGSLHAGVNRKVQEINRSSDLEKILYKPNW